MHGADLQRLRGIAGSLVVWLLELFVLVRLLMFGILRVSIRQARNYIDTGDAKLKSWNSIQRGLASPLTDRMRQKDAKASVAGYLGS